MTKVQRIINDCFAAFGVLCILYYLGMGIAVRFGQSLLFLWPVIGLLCLARHFLWRRAFRKGKRSPFPGLLLWPFRVLILLFLAFFLFVETYIFAGAFHEPPAGLDAVVVLGARVNADGPSGAMRQRADAALRYLQENPDTLCVVSGGQGDDEPMSEAACLHGLLVQGGIASERIVLEDASTNTGENLRYSFALLPEGVERVGIVSNDFHICRALYIGRQLGSHELFGVPARSTVFGFIHYALREFCGLVVSWVTGELPFRPFFQYNTNPI